MTTCRRTLPNVFMQAQMSRGHLHLCSNAIRFGDFQLASVQRAHHAATVSSAASARRTSVRSAAGCHKTFDSTAGSSLGHLFAAGRSSKDVSFCTGTPRLFPRPPPQTRKSGERKVCRRRRLVDPSKTPPLLFVCRFHSVVLFLCAGLKGLTWLDLFTAAVPSCCCSVRRIRPNLTGTALFLSCCVLAVCVVRCFLYARVRKVWYLLFFRVITHPPHNKRTTEKCAL